MKKYKFLPLFLAAFLTVPFTGCEGRREPAPESVISEEFSHVSLEGIAENVVQGEVAQEVSQNDTVFKLNRVIDSGESAEEGGNYFYLDVNITNPTSVTYSLNTLNNFYVLFPDGSETHFDVRTQLYGAKNIDGYVANPFDLPANGDFSGIIGGFIIPAGTENFTVCFFPSKENESDKSNVIKVDVDSSSIVKLK